MTERSWRGVGGGIAIALVVGACSGVHGPPTDPKEHVRGEHYRVVPETPEHFFPALEAAIGAEGLRLHRADARDRMLEVSERYRGRDAVRRLADMADLSAARREGLRTVAEYVITYRLFLLPADESSTRLKVTSTIQAIDRSQATWIGGVLQPLTRFVDVPSRGVAERALVRRLGSSLFAAEELLLMVGELGVD